MGENSGGARGRSRSRGGGVSGGTKRISERNAGGNGANDRKRSLRKQSSGTTDRANTANSASTSLQKDLPTPRAASEHSDVDSIGDDGYATPGMVRMPAQEVYEHSDMPEELLVQSRKEVTLRRLRRSDIVRTEEEKKVLDAVYATLKFGRAMICPYCEEEDATMVSTSRIRESRTQTWKCQSCNMKISGFHAEKWILYNWPKLCKRYEVYLSKDGTDGDKAAWKAWGITDRQFDQNLHRVFIETEIEKYELAYLRWILEGGYEVLRCIPCYYCKKKALRRPARADTQRLYFHITFDCESCHTRTRGLSSTNHLLSIRKQLMKENLSQRIKDKAPIFPEDGEELSQEVEITTQTTGTAIIVPETQTQTQEAPTQQSNISVSETDGLSAEERWRRELGSFREESPIQNVFPVAPSEEGSTAKLQSELEKALEAEETANNIIKARDEELKRLKKSNDKLQGELAEEKKVREKAIAEIRAERDRGREEVEDMRRRQQRMERTINNMRAERDKTQEIMEIDLALARKEIEQLKRLAGGGDPLKDIVIDTLRDEELQRIAAENRNAETGPTKEWEKKIMEAQKKMAGELARTQKENAEKMTSIESKLEALMNAQARSTVIAEPPPPTERRDASTVDAPREVPTQNASQNESTKTYLTAARQVRPRIADLPPVIAERALRARARMEMEIRKYARKPQTQTTSNGALQPIFLRKKGIRMSPRTMKEILRDCGAPNGAIRNIGFYGGAIMELLVEPELKQEVLGVVKAMGLTHLEGMSALDDLMRSGKATGEQDAKKANAKMGLRRAMRTLNRERVPKRVREYFQSMREEAEEILGDEAKEVQAEMETNKQDGGRDRSGDIANTAQGGNQNSDEENDSEGASGTGEREGQGDGADELESGQESTADADAAAGAASTGDGNAEEIANDVNSEKEGLGTGDEVTIATNEKADGSAGRTDNAEK